MALSDNTFPQSGDINDGARFAQLIGQENLLDFVESGLTLDTDFGNDEVTVSEGVCYISQDQDEATSDGQTIQNLGYAVQVAEETVSLDFAVDNYIYVTPDLDSQDTNSISVYNSTGDASDTELLIGYVNNDVDTVDERNRNPSVVFETAELRKFLSNAIYETEEDLPDDGEEGDQAYVQATDSLYVFESN